MKRMAEMKKQVESKQRMEQSGYGIAQEIDADKILVRILLQNATKNECTADSVLKIL